MNDQSGNLVPAQPDREPAAWRRDLTALLVPVDQRSGPGDPRRPIRIGIIAVVLFFVVFLGWASIARLDAAITGQGFVVVSGNRKAVQHRDGGIVDKLLVREGDEVKAGQVLLTLNDDELGAKERATSSQVIALQAYKARLTAEIEGNSSIHFPDYFKTLTGDDREDADVNMAVQQKEFSVRRLALVTQKNVLSERKTELHHQADGDQAQVTAAEDQAALIRDELKGMRSLQSQGYVAMSKVRELERAEAQYEGARGEYSGSVAKSMASIGEAEVQSISLDKNQAADAAQQFREADLKLADLEPQLADAKAQIARTIIRAPVSGQVVGLKVFTAGGVVAAGETLMEIVPTHEDLVINARIEPNDIDGLHIGQKTEIRIPAFHNRGLPILNGMISKVSADRLTDEKTGKSYFEVEATVPAAELKTMRDIRGSKTDLIPGLPVDIIVPQRKRTALAYLFEPIDQALWRSGREQ